MMGCQTVPDRLFYEFRLDMHVPADHLLRRVDQLLDFTAIRRQLAPFYSATGRPSVDPELMIRMLLIGYMFGIRSERRLCEEVHLNLAYRWFCRLGLDGDVPERSTFSKARHGRFRESDAFRLIFEQVVATCMQQGLIVGEGLAVDGSFIQADVSDSRRIAYGEEQRVWEASEELRRPVREYLASLDERMPPTPDEPKPIPPKVISLTDPMSSLSKKHGIASFGYFTHYLVDTAHGIIVDVDGSPARSAQEPAVAKAMLSRTIPKLGRRPSRFTADTAYGTGPMLSWLVEREIAPHVPVLDRAHQTNGKLDRSAFVYEEQHDQFRCPSGHVLKFTRIRPDHQERRYRARSRDCRVCALKDNCTSDRSRMLSVSVYEKAREHARQLSTTEAFQASLRQRKKVEMLFAHLKRNLGLRRLRLRGLTGAKDEFLLAATAQNLRRMARMLPVLG